MNRYVHLLDGTLLGFWYFEGDPLPGDWIRRDGMLLIVRKREFSGTDSPTLFCEQMPCTERGEGSAQ